ncbi:hypothetical protein ESB00_02730 [Oleiharenicola lentus]|uniref:DUF7305 domain-containing protein n=1 Tax=Oleiharenicola lentus TaxID=2508720 RepID=A0A4Q1C7Q2_9BACT|nr:hypothetical protein [Oleiharenicola lentus]RXK54831.1 hypothetical protein ESB00_02730 [Oleiharenicola lentus]
MMPGRNNHPRSGKDRRRAAADARTGARRSNPGPGSTRGTVTLVALCFVAVLGISLASYIAICTRAMQLSNRSFQASVSKQLAEAGLEEAMRAFNQHNWDDWSSGGISVNWTLDTTNKRATATMTFPADKFGQGATAQLKLRVDNYDADVVGATWSSSKNYAPGDLVERSGIWYRCLQTHSNIQPIGDISHYWVPEFVPSLWDSSTTYSSQDMVFHAGYWYRCSSSNTNSAPPNANWVRINAVNKDSTSGISGVQDAVVNWFGTWYRWNSGGWDAAPPISWRWRNTGLVYSYNDLVNYNNLWYRYISATPTNAGSSYSNPGADTSRWALQSNMWVWSSSGLKYNKGDVAFYSGQWYRCLRAHTSSTSIQPTNTTYWSNTPRYSPDWSPGERFSQYDTVRRNGVWYLSLQNNNTAQDPATDSDNSHWIGANTTDSNYTWNSTTNYSAGAYRCYGGVWYRCTSANTNKAPNDTAFWTAAWSNSWGITTGAPVVYAEATITFGSSPAQRTQLRALIAPAPLFPNALAATGSISANSGGTVDSYDSTLGTYASQLDTATNYSAVVAAGNTSGTAITLSSPTIQGYVAAPAATTAPYAPLMALGTSVIVKGSSATPSPKVDKSRVSRSPYIPQFSTLPGGADGLANNWSNTPKGTALALAATINIGTPGAITPARYYYDGDLTIGNSTVTNLRINGPVILYIDGDLLLTQSGSTGRIDITSRGSAEIHVAGTFRADAGSEGILNATTDPKSLIIICDTDSNSMHYYSEGVNPLYGVIYIPYSQSNNGYFNDNNNAQIYGAVSANNITYSGANLNVHYDTSLRYATFGGVDQPWTVTEWRELPATEQATMP